MAKPVEACPIEGFRYLNERTDQYISVPQRISDELKAARTPDEVQDVLKRREKDLARNYDKHDEYLSCDNVADLMVQVLKSKGIRAKGVVGYSDEGSSHVWVEVGGKKYDPTEQGCWTTPPKEDPRTGYYIHRGKLAEKYGFGYLEQKKER